MTAVSYTYSHAHPHPPQFEDEPHQAHPQPITNALTVAILVLVNIYFLHRIVNSRYIVFHILKYYKF